MEGIAERRVGSFMKKWKSRYLILNRDVLQSFGVNEDGGPEIYDMKAEIYLPELIRLEALPNCGLDLRFEDQSTWQLRFADLVDYQCWLSCFVVFHADTLPFVPSTYLDAIWTAFLYIEQRATKVEGIFRVPGLKKETLKLTKELIQAGTIGGHPVNLEGVHIPTLCSAAKILIDRLPATLLTEHLYQQFIEADKEDGMKLANLVYQLPPQNHAVLQHILFTLAKIADETELTKMNSQNLGILYGTMFVSRRKGVQEYMMDFQDLQLLISSLITYYDIIFKNSKPSYPLYIPKLQRDLLVAQNIDIQPIKMMLSSKASMSFSELSDNISSSINCSPVKTNEQLVSLKFVDDYKSNENSTDLVVAKHASTRFSTKREVTNFSSSRLDHLFMTLRENVSSREAEFNGGCCILRRRKAPNELTSDIDRRRTSRFASRSSSG